MSGHERRLTWSRCGTGAYGRRDTFSHVTRWLQELRENSTVTDKMVVILVGNKNDKEGR